MVVTHAGVGSILTCLLNGKRPVVVPRLAGLGEHVDDHQLELARRLRDIDVVTLVEDSTDLRAAIETGSDMESSNLPRGGSSRLADDLAVYLHEAVKAR